jgi:hypothetical protein
MALSVFNWAGGPEDPSYNFVYFGWSFVALENNPLCIDFRFSIGIGFFLSAFALILSALSDSSGSFMVDFWLSVNIPPRVTDLARRFFEGGAR